MFTHELKFILLPQFIATMYVHCLHWLMSTGLLFQRAFCQPCKSTTGEMAPREGSSLAVESDMAPTVSACLSRPCNGILALCGYMYMS